MSNKNVIIIGASGYGKVVADIVLQSGDHLLGFLDDGRSVGELVFGYPVLGKTENWDSYDDSQFVIAIGNASAREAIANRLAGAIWYTAIHPKAVISPLETTIGAGSVVMANAVVNPSAHIGKHCLLNTGSIVEHDNHIDDYVHISVGTKLAGTVSIGKHSWIGIGAVVNNNVTICNDCTIGAGAVVTRNLTECGTYVGIPARKIK